MRSIHMLTAAVAALSLCAACGSTQQSASNAANTSAPTQNRPQTVAVPPIASAHGDNAVAPTAPAAPASADKPSLATPELDAKIEKAEAKAKAAGASEADKKAAAKAYFERADFFRGEGSPVLYKFALRDYRVGLRYDPTDSDARGKMDEIIAIYKQMNRPVPELGNEQ